MEMESVVSGVASRGVLGARRSVVALVAIMVAASAAIGCSAAPEAIGDEETAASGAGEGAIGSVKEEFSYNGVSLWTKDSLKFKITSFTSDITATAARDALSRAALTWSNHNRVKINYDSAIATPDIEVKFFTKGSPPAGWSDISATEPIGYATKSRIALNDAYNWGALATNPDLESAAVHLFGHVLGLGHSSVSTSSVMYPTLPNNTARRGLTFDDTQAIQTRYPYLWTTNTTAVIRDIAYGGSRGGGIYAVTSTGGVASWSGSSWNALGGVPGTATSVAVDSNAGVWITLNTGAIWTLPSGGAWTLVLGAAREIAAGTGGQVWAIGSTPATGDATIYLYNPSNILNPWIASSQTANHMAVDSTGRALVVRANGTIFRSQFTTGADGTWDTLPGCAGDIAAGSSLAVWATGCPATPGTDSAIYLWNEQAAIAPGASSTGAPARAAWVAAPSPNTGAGLRLGVNYNGRPLVAQANGTFAMNGF
jgi:hypothetical protein